MDLNNSERKGNPLVFKIDFLVKKFKLFFLGKKGMLVLKDKIRCNVRYFVERPFKDKTKEDMGFSFVQSNS
jgi:hypothetical protein